MAVSGRTTKGSSVIAVFCIVVYIAAIMLGTIQIVLNIGERRENAETEYQNLKNRAVTSAVFLGFLTEAYKETINDFLQNHADTLLAIIISGSAGEADFEKYPGSGIDRIDGSPRLKTGISYDYPTIPPYMNISGQRNVRIDAVYSLIDNQLLFNVLRNTLFVVLVSLAIAFIALLFELARKNKTAWAKPLVTPLAPETKSESSPDNFDFTVPQDSFQNNYEGSSQNNFQDNSIDSPVTDLPGDPFPDFSIPEMDDNKEDEQAAEDEIRQPESNVLENWDIPLELDSAEEGPQGLYNPRSNVGWESYTTDRLASEIHRCSSFEQDLTFLVMDFIDNTEINDSLYSLFAGEATGFFGMRDLIFENGNSGLSVIMPNLHLEQGMSKAEEFKKRITARLPEYFEGRKGLCAGLSSRSGRIMEAKRLIVEAMSALDRAKTDAVSPIIAFKSDPDKYRDFIRGNHK